MFIRFENFGVVMKTGSELEAEFREDLQVLLNKYKATLSADDHWQGYAECGQDVRMTVSIAGKYEDGEMVQEWADIDLGHNVDYEESL